MSHLICRSLFAVLTIVSSVSAFADEAPPEWRLPNEGQGCERLAHFEEGHTCGDKAYQTWKCPASDDQGGWDQYLIVGEYGSDVANACSPTFFVQKVIKEVSSK